MKIVFIGGRDVTVAGGIETYVLNLATQLVKMGHEPIVFCESDHNGKDSVNGFEVIHQKGPKSRFFCKPWLGLKATIKAIITIKDFDIIHYNTWAPALWSPLVGVARKNCLMQGHGLEWKQSKYTPRQKKILRLCEHYTAWITPHLIMCSDSQTQYFKDKYGYTATTIPGAITVPENYIGDRDGVLEKYNLTADRYFILLARLTEVKNPHFLINAFKKAHHTGYKLVIAGDNSAQPEFVEHLHDLAAGCDDIVFTGSVFGQEKETLLRNSYMFCIPSTSEGLAISLLEAMSRRVPVLASDIPANKEVLDDDKAVWVRPENEDDLVNAIETAIENPEFIASTVEDNYRKVMESYTWERVAEKYVGYLNSVCRKRRKD